MAKKKKYVFLGAYIAQPDEVLGDKGQHIRAIVLRNEAMDELREAFADKSRLIEEEEARGKAKAYKEEVKANRVRIDRLQALIRRQNKVIDQFDALSKA